MAYYNPFSTKSNEDITGAWNRAFAPNPALANNDPEEYFRSTSSLYSEQGQNAVPAMLDTVANKFLGELGVDIADRQARRNFAQNLLGNLKDQYLVNAAAAGDLTKTGKMSEIIGAMGGDYLRGGTVPTNPYRDDVATIRRNYDAAVASGKAGEDYRDFLSQPDVRGALENRVASQLAGPYRAVFNDAAQRANIAFKGDDPFTGYYGNLTASPLLAGGTARGVAPVWTSPAGGGGDQGGGTQPTGTTGDGGHGDGGAATPPTGTTGGTTTETGGPGGGYEGYPGSGSEPYGAPRGPGGTTTGATGPQTPESLNIAGWFQELFGRQPQPYELSYWTQKVNDLGPQMALNRLQASPAAQAYKMAGGVTPYLSGPNDLHGAEAYYQYLSDRGLAPADREGFIQSLLSNYQQWAP